MSKKCIVCLIVYITILYSVFAQNQRPTLDFYGTPTTSSGGDTIQLTQDLFFTQLIDFNTFAIIDKRNIPYDTSITTSQSESADYIFFAEITEQNGWLCVLNIIHLQTQESFTSTKLYTDYYKILIESKAVLASLLQNVQDGISTESKTETTTTIDTSEEKITSLETLAGTWQGEQHVDKIVLLRGGRGYVIFDNGSTMSVSLSLNDSSITVMQTSKPNASYFPHLPREQALQIAPTAPPIEWAFSTSSTGSQLKGEKKLLSENLQVTWQKQ